MQHILQPCCMGNKKMYKKSFICNCIMGCWNKINVVTCLLNQYSQHAQGMLTLKCIPSEEAWWGNLQNQIWHENTPTLLPNVIHALACFVNLPRSFRRLGVHLRHAPIRAGRRSFKASFKLFVLARLHSHLCQFHLTQGQLLFSCSKLTLQQLNLGERAGKFISLARRVRSARWPLVDNISGQYKICKTI